MAAAAAVLGGLMGFLAAVLGFVIFSLSPLHALVLWPGVGIASALGLVGLGFAMNHAHRVRLAFRPAH